MTFPFPTQVIFSALSQRPPSDPCPKCQGQGTVLQHHYVTNEFGVSETNYEPTQCPSCQGSGKARITA